MKFNLPNAEVVTQKVLPISVLVLQVLFVIYYSYLRIDNSHSIRAPRSFGDTPDYFHNAGLPVYSSEFWTDARPPVTALFWKLVDADPDKIFPLQLYFSIVCWVILAFAAAHAMKSLLLRLSLFVGVLGFSLSHDIILWDPFLGSESISLALMALLLAITLWLFLEWKPYKLILLVLTGVVFAFARDTNAYLLLIVAAINIPVFWFSARRNSVLAVSFAFLVLFAISSQLADAGLRPFRAILMNTALRIFPSEEYTEYFRKRGMPVDDRLVNMSRNIEPGEKYVVYTALISDADQQGYRQWVVNWGRAEYIRFLWFFKVDTFQNVFTETAEASFFPYVHYYAATGYHPILESERLAEFLYPTRFGLLFFFCVNIFAAFMAALAWRDKKALWYIPILMILLTYPQAVLVWAADVNDMARHSIPHNVLMRLGFWLLLFFAFDSLFDELPERFPFLKKLQFSAWQKN